MPAATWCGAADLVSMHRDVVEETVKEFAKQDFKITSYTHKNLPGSLFILPGLPGQADVLSMLVEIPLSTRVMRRKMVEIAPKGPTRGKKRKADEMETTQDPFPAIKLRKVKDDGIFVYLLGEHDVLVRTCPAYDMIKDPTASLLRWNRKEHVYWTTRFAFNDAVSDRLRNLSYPPRPHRFIFKGHHAELTSHEVEDIFYLVICPSYAQGWRHEIDDHFGFLQRQGLLWRNEKMELRNQLSQLQTITSPENLGKKDLACLRDRPHPLASVETLYPEWAQERKEFTEEHGGIPFPFKSKYSQFL